MRRPMPRTAKMLLASALFTVFLGCANGQPPALAWDELFAVRDSIVVSDSLLAEINSMVSGAATKPRQLSGLSSQPSMIWTSRQGRELASYVMEVPVTIRDTPYWGSWFRRVGATDGHRAVAAANLLYPIQVYSLDGVALGSVGSPPASWRQARPPQQAEFTPDQQAEARAYLQSFTVITGLAVVADSILIVAHGRYREDAHGLLAHGNSEGQNGRGEVESRYGLALVTTLVDVYIDGVRVASDIPAPGEIFGNWGETVFFLRKNAPELGWTLTQYVLNRDGI